MRIEDFAKIKKRKATPKETKYLKEAENFYDKHCSSIRNVLQESNGLSFKELEEKLKETTSVATLSKHLKEHLQKEGKVANINYKYIWNPPKELTYPPTIIHTLYKFEITIKPKVCLSTTTLEFFNNSETGLSSYSWYFTSKEPVSWEKMQPEIILEYENKSYPLNKKEHIHFLSSNPYHYRFRVDLPFDLLQNKPAKLIFKVRRFYEKDTGSIILYPKSATEKIVFILNCPTPDYQLRVRKINQETGKDYPTTTSPSKNDRTITWQITSHNLEDYYQFEWNKFT